MNKYSVSVCIATHNGSKYIQEQLESILHQINHDDEIVVVDDMSSDNTVDVITGLNDQRIRLYLNSRRMGPIGSFERAISLSSKEIIFLSDQDDIWMPNKVESVKEDIITQGCILSLSDAYISYNGILDVETFYEFRDSKAGLLRNIARNSYIGCCMAFSHELKDKILPFPKDIPMHDQWIGLVGEMTGRVKFRKERLVIYRRHSNNVTAMKPGNLPSMIRKRVNLIKNILVKAYHV